MVWLVSTVWFGLVIYHMLCLCVLLFVAGSRHKKLKTKWSTVILCWPIDQTGRANLLLLSWPSWSAAMFDFDRPNQCAR